MSLKQATPAITEIEIEAHNALARLSRAYEMLGDKRRYGVNRLICKLYEIRWNPHPS